MKLICLCCGEQEYDSVARLCSNCGYCDEPADIEFLAEDIDAEQDLEETDGLEDSDNDMSEEYIKPEYDLPCPFE